MHCENVTLELGSKGIVRSPIKLFPVLLLFDHFSVSYPVDSDDRDTLLITVFSVFQSSLHCYLLFHSHLATATTTVFIIQMCMCTQLHPHVRMRIQSHTCFPWQCVSLVAMARVVSSGV